MKDKDNRSADDLPEQKILYHFHILINVTIRWYIRVTFAIKLL